MQVEVKEEQKVPFLQSRLVEQGVAGGRVGMDGAVPGAVEGAGVELLRGATVPVAFAAPKAAVVGAGVWPTTKRGTCSCSSSTSAVKAARADEEE